MFEQTPDILTFKEMSGTLKDRKKHLAGFTP